MTAKTDVIFRPGFIPCPHCMGFSPTGGCDECRHTGQIRVRIADGGSAAPGALDGLEIKPRRSLGSRVWRFFSRLHGGH